MNSPDEPAPPVDRAVTANVYSILRVAIAAVCLTILAGVVLVLAVYSAGRPNRLVNATGTVTWDGKPVTVGAVMTVLESDPTFSSIGPLDENGRFVLSTYGNGDGTATGRHKLVVASFGDGMPPPPLVPAEYTQLKTTPLVIEVSADPAKNNFDIRLTGTLPVRTNRAPPRDRDPGAAREARPPRPSIGAAQAPPTDVGEPDPQNPESP